MIKIKVLFLIFLVTTLAVYPAYAATVDELQQNIQNNQDKLNEIQSQIQSSQSESNSISGSINQLDQQIAKAETEIGNMDKTISDLDTNIKSEAQKLEEENASYNNQEELLKARLKSMYEGANVSYLEVLLSSKSLTEIYTKYEVIRTVFKRDKGLLDDISSKKNKIEELKNQLEAQRKTVEDTKKQRSTALEGLSASRGAKQDYLRKVNSDIEQYKRSEQELKKQSDDFAKMIKQMQQAQSSPQKYTGGVMKWPAPNYYTISDPYGPRIHPVYKTQTVHTGMDIAAPYGADIIAASKGTVIYAQWNDGGYGNCVIIDHGGGITTLYGHCSSLLAKVGDVVNAGDVIAKVGSTGISTGNHVHFEVRVNGDPTDPSQYLK